jgi:hypothetical protein
MEENMRNCLFVLMILGICNTALADTIKIAPLNEPVAPKQTIVHPEMPATDDNEAARLVEQFFTINDQPTETLPASGDKPPRCRPFFERRTMHPDKLKHT